MLHFQLLLPVLPQLFFVLTVSRGPALGDDPHFSIALPGGKLLCYTVQGKHGFTFNLISSEMVFMNAMFAPDSRRDEVTWLGSMGIIVKSGYRKSNSTALRFEALEKKIYINDKVVLEPRNVEKLTFSNGKLTISEAPPMEGFKYPKVYVDLQDVGLSFSIQFLAEHLDLFWHSTGQQTENSHGIIGTLYTHITNVFPMCITGIYVIHTSPILSLHVYALLLQMHYIHTSPRHLIN